MPDNFPSIMVLSGVRGDTRRYRTFHLYEQTRLLGMDTQLSHITDGELQKKADRSSVVILHRASFTKQIAWLIGEVHRKDGLFIQDIDDLLFEPDAFKYIQSIDFSDPIRSSLYQEEMRLYRKTVDECDGVIASTNYLAERVHLLGKSVRVHRNAFSMEMLEVSERAFQNRQSIGQRIVIGYASGTATHDQDFALIKPALKSVLHRFPNVDLKLVGPMDSGSDWGDLEKRIQHIPLVPWRNLPDILASFDINLAPLRIDNPFGGSKSEVKFMEAALVRVPTIASPNEAFKFAIKRGETSLLAADEQEWEDAMVTLLQQPELRHHMGHAAFQDVMLRYHPNVRAKEFIETLSAFMGYELDLSGVESAPGVTLQFSKSYWSSAQAEKSPTLLQMGWHTMHYRGLMVLIKQIWIYLRRLLAPLIPFQKAT